MPNDAPHISVSAESLERKHEAREPHLRNPLIVIASVAFMIFFCLAGARILAAIFSKERPMQKMQPLGLIAAPNLKPLARFPKPNLQIDDDHAERIALLAAQNEKLNSYGWMDRSNGIVRIPIARAMDLILQRGLPTRTNGISQTDGSPIQLIQKRPEQR
ncbi:MAG TPA: hypothetical protein VFC85_00675 [Verrucomicrobiae bacterium]|nr:hypothetical protein [Verrucomicrobiae bacterium]